MANIKNKIDSGISTLKDANEILRLLNLFLDSPTMTKENLRNALNNYFKAKK